MTKKMGEDQIKSNNYRKCWVAYLLFKLHNNYKKCWVAYLLFKLHNKYKKFKHLLC